MNVLLSIVSEGTRTKWRSLVCHEQTSISKCSFTRYDWRYWRYKLRGIEVSADVGAENASLKLYIFLSWKHQKSTRIIKLPAKVGFEGLWDQCYNLVENVFETQVRRFDLLREDSSRYFPSRKYVCGCAQIAADDSPLRICAWRVVPR